jgi:hypothetical protein
VGGERVIAVLLGILWPIFLSIGADTARTRCDGYLVEANTGSGWFVKNIYADSLMSRAKTPRLSENAGPWEDTLWVSLSTAGGATSLRCRCTGGALSNVVALVPRGSFARDTTMYGSRHDWYEPRIAGPTRGAYWHGALGDTSAFYVEPLDAEQSRRRLAHLAACGYYWQRGVKMVTP